MAIGVLIAKKAPPPGKLKGYAGRDDPSGPDNPAEEASETDSEEADEKAARIEAAKPIIAAVKANDPEAFCEALDDYLAR